MIAQPTKRKYKASVMLVMTFVLGFAVGFSLCYALMETLGMDFSRPTESVQETREHETAPTPEASPATPPATPDPTPSPEIADEPEVDVPMLAARHLFIGIQGQSLDDATQALLTRYPLGGVVLREENIENEVQAVALIREIRDAGAGHAIPPYIAVKQDGGARNPLQLMDPPGPAELGALDHRGATEESARIAAQAAKQIGVEVILGPPLDQYLPEVSDPNLELDQFAFGENPEFVTQMGMHYAHVLMEHGVLPVAKHYPGLGAAIQDAQGRLHIAAEGAQQLALSFLPFARAADQGIPAILISRVAVPGLDLEEPDRPALLSPRLVKGIIREQWYYEGVLIGDDLMMLSDAPTDTAVQALRAGCDAVMLLDTDAETVEAVIEAITEAEEARMLSTRELEAARERLTQWRDRLDEEVDLQIDLEPDALEEREPLDWPEPQPEPEVAEPPTEAPTPDPVESVPTEDEVHEEAEAVEETTAPESDAAPTDEEVEPAEPDTDAAPPEPAYSVTRHTISEGDTLFGIARRYGVREEDIMRWNNMDSNVVRLGFTLEIREYAPGAQPDPAPEAEEESAPEPEPESETEADADEVAPASVTIEDAQDAEEISVEAALETADAQDAVDNEYRRHQIEVGDNLERIANRYGVRAQDIIELNDIENPDIIPLGSDLLIPHADNDE